MKKPKSPPKLDRVLANVDRALEIISTFRSADEDYLHWDDLLHRRPPDGFNHEEWWFGLKMNRQFKTVPLRDKDGHEFKYSKTDTIEEAQHLIDSRARGRIGVPDHGLNAQVKDRYYISSLMEEAITSSQLEGAVTTRQKAKEMIRSGRKPRDKSEQMILNNYHTMRMIDELKDKDLTPNIVLNLQRSITEGTLEDPADAGQLRSTDDIHVVDVLTGEIAHTPPPASELPSRLVAMCDFANAKTSKEFIHPVIRSIVLHFWLAYDHPFVDGNGRTARVLFYWSMLRHNYWLFEFLSISSIIKKGPAKYSRAYMLTETDSNDLTYFIHYHLNIVERSIKQFDDYVDRKTQEVREIERKLGGVGRLNHRQRALLSHALRHPYQEYTIGSHQTSHNVVHQTARTDLAELVELRLLVEHRAGRRRYFTPAKDIEHKVAKLRA